MEGAKIPTGLVSQLQVEENLFMADRNFKPSLPPPRPPPGGCCSSQIIMMAMPWAVGDTP